MLDYGRIVPNISFGVRTWLETVLSETNKVRLPSVKQDVYLNPAVGMLNEACRKSLADVV